MTRLLVHGAGRMARRVVSLLPEFERFELLGLVSRSRPPFDPGCEWYESLSQIGSGIDLLIDFTLPDGTSTAARWCADNGTALLSGTTGLRDEDMAALEDAALKVPVLWAPNMSHGVALMSALVREAAAQIDSHAAVTVTDIHHVHKRDAPSGTALALAAAIKTGRADGMGVDPVFSSVREGEVIGEHTVRFALADEVLEISHRALDRDVFARGALKAAEWLANQPPGYYSTSDWLGLA